MLGDFIATEASQVPSASGPVDLTFTYEGTANVPSIEARRSADGQSVEIHPWDESEGLWGGDNLGLLSYGGRQHVILYKDFRHPTVTRSLVTSDQCNFSTSTVESIGPKALEPKLCQRILQHEPIEQITFDGPYWLTTEEVGKAHRETSITGTRMLDIAKDGNPINVARLEYTSGAGAGCDATYFQSMDKNGTELGADERGYILDTLQHGENAFDRARSECGNVASFFKYEGRIYFENKPREDLEPRDSNKYHRVATYRNGESKDVCDFQFVSKVSPQ